MALLLDVDGDGTISFAYDGLLINAYLALRRSDYPTVEFDAKLDTFINSPTATRTGTTAREWMDTNLLPLLDIDGSGNLPSYGRDGLLINAYLFFRPITTSTDFAKMDLYLSSPYATRDINQVIAYLDNLYNINI